MLCIAFVPIGHTLALAFVAGAVAVAHAVRAGLEAWGARGAGARKAWANVITYVVLCVFALALTTASERLARYRANRLIVAVEHYKVEHGHYPERLNELVPHYIEAIPRASYSFLGEFQYQRDSGGGDAAVSLRYITLPPFDGPMYRFDRGRWSDELER